VLDSLDDTTIASLRRVALALADGTELSRCDDHQVADMLGSAGRSLHPQGGALELYRLAPAAAAAPAAPAPPAAPPRSSSAAAAAPPTAPSTSALSPDLDVAAMVRVLTEAARDGVPFCEECERARRARAAA
jgi:hypothetical protein